MNPLAMKLFDLLIFILLSTYLTISFTEIIIVRAIQAFHRIMAAMTDKEDGVDEKEKSA
jgi:hypothetical protein